MIFRSIKVYIKQYGIDRDQKKGLVRKPKSEQDLK